MKIVKGRTDGALYVRRTDLDLQGFIKAFGDMKDPDIICANCGRIVLVGRCCDSPKIVDRGELSPEALQQIIDLTEKPANPTPELKELMARNIKQRRDIKNEIK